MSQRSSYLLFLLGLALMAGCGQPKPTPPVGLTKPPPAAIAKAEQRTHRATNIVVTVTLPKGNPTRGMLTGDKKADMVILRKLPPLKCHVEFEIEPGMEYDRFPFGITIGTPSGSNLRAHALGHGEARRTKEGRYAAEIELSQSYPLQLEDKAVAGMNISGIGEKRSNDVKQYQTNEGKVVVKMSE